MKTPSTRTLATTIGTFTYVSTARNPYTGRDEYTVTYGGYPSNGANGGASCRIHAWAEREDLYSVTMIANGLDLGITLQKGADGKLCEVSAKCVDVGRRDGRTIYRVDVTSI